jgi:hypothetical protein
MRSAQAWEQTPDDTECFEIMPKDFWALAHNWQATWQETKLVLNSRRETPNSSLQTSTFKGHFVDGDWRAVLPGQDFETVLLGFEHHIPRNEFVDSVAIEVTHAEDVVIGSAWHLPAYIAYKVKWLQHPIDLCK